MSTRIRNMPDFVAGAMFIVIGLAVTVMACDYNPGTAARMGPGYFPRLLGIVLAFLGTVVALQSLSKKNADGSETAFPLRSVLIAIVSIAAFWILLATVGKRGFTGLDVPVIVMLVLSFFASRELFWVLAGIAAFGLLLQPAGLVVSSFVLILVSAFGSHEFNWKSTLISWIALLLLCLGVFVWGLKLQFPVWPKFLVS